ncbi:MAG: hypothetical protein WDN46_08280 [Methylocella sp.]
MIKIIKAVNFAVMVMMPAAAHAQMRAFVVTSCDSLPAIYSPGTQGIPLALAAAGEGGGGAISAPLGGTTPLAQAVAVTIVPNVKTLTDRSGAVTTGGTSQTLVASASTRMTIFIENPCTGASQFGGTTPPAAESLFINFTAAASATAGGSIELSPCGVYSTGTGPVSTEAITVTATTTGHRWTAKIEFSGAGPWKDKFATITIIGIPVSGFCWS